MALTSHCKEGTKSSSRSRALLIAPLLRWERSDDLASCCPVAVQSDADMLPIRTGEHPRRTSTTAPISTPTASRRRQSLISLLMNSWKLPAARRELVFFARVRLSYPRSGQSPNSTVSGLLRGSGGYGTDEDIQNQFRNVLDHAVRVLERVDTF